MNKYEEFYAYLADCLERFKEWDKSKTIRLVSHLDADGICACSVMVKALNTDNRKYSLSIVQTLSDEVLDDLVREPYDYYIFTDLGSGKLTSIKKKFVGSEVLILDHHEPEEVHINGNVMHVNPHLFGIDGGEEVSGAGVVYLFLKDLHEQVAQLAPIAIVGAVGDMQEKGDGFLTLNSDILEVAKKHGTIKVIKGLRIFGAQTRPLYKILEYTTDPYIPGVSGSESGAIQFLTEIGVQAKQGQEWRKIVHLDEEEIKKLVSGIIVRRLGEDKPEDVLGNVYILTNEEKESPFRDAKEFSTLLNACGRLDKASLGIGACLGDKRTKEKAMVSLRGYKRMIINALNWYRDNRDGEAVENKEGYTIINAQDNIKASMIGTLASILSKGKDLEEGTYILGLADLLDGHYKVSLRFCGRGKIDLKETISSITEKVGGEAGGHQFAAGARVKEEDVEKFIAEAKEVLGKRALEEAVH